MAKHGRGFLGVVASVLALSCTQGGGVDAGGVDPGFDATTPFDSGTRDASFFDPFDPENACAASTVETERIPGSLLIVFDRSGSMGTDTPGRPTMWELATTAINDILGRVSDDLSVGLMLFPSSGTCSIDAAPEVPVAPLPTSRAMIRSALASASPGGGTPAFAGLLAGYDYLDTLRTPGQRGVVLVSDGGEGCDFDRYDEVMMRVQSELDAKNRLTFAVGMNFADNTMSTIAYNGGTSRVDTCVPQCTSPRCDDSTDCGGAACLTIIEGDPGFCGCDRDDQCVTPQTCEPPVFPIPCDGLPPGPIRNACEVSNSTRCAGESNCCHYTASASDFRVEFEAALNEIARRLLDSCIFEVPRGAVPSDFDPTLVNVGVTFDGEERRVLRRSGDTSTDSWDYVPGSDESIIIQGPICGELLMGSATVEIVLGCPTILI